MMGADDRLSLPVADAARSARPDLDSGIEGLGIERTGVASSEPGSGRTVRRLRAHNSGLADGNRGFGFGFSAGLHACTALVDADVQRTRRESASRPQRLWREHGPRQVKAEEFVRTVWVSDRQTAPGQKRRAQDGTEIIPRDHGGLLKYPKQATRII